ncbi:MAG: response regulator [Proteobacteria bacterium]|nr:response regulator [Pseudomonadota bacterium]
MTSERPVVVVIEDEPQIRRFLRTSLDAHEFTVHEAETGKQGLVECATRRPEVVVLDLGLPDMDGVELIRKLREWSEVPVVVLSARSQEADKIAALEAGADDYVVKPFGMGELVARLRVALRHSAATGEDAQSVFRAGELEVDLLNRRVRRAGADVHLTPTEYRLLVVLVKHPGKVLTQRFLLKEVWGPGYAESAHYLRIYMANLRKKLEADPAQPRHLLTETGVGYRFDAGA